MTTAATHADLMRLLRQSRAHVLALCRADGSADDIAAVVTGLLRHARELAAADSNAAATPLADVMRLLEQKGAHVLALCRTTNNNCSAADIAAVMAGLLRDARELADADDTH